MARRRQGVVLIERARATPPLADERLRAEIDKLAAETTKLRQDQRPAWRTLQFLGLIGPALVFLVGILSIYNLQLQARNERFLDLLANVGADEPRERLAGVAGLAQHRRAVSWYGETLLGRSWTPIFASADGQTRIATAVGSALLLEDDDEVRRAMLNLLQAFGAEALRPLRDVRAHLIRRLKDQETSAAPWERFRDTLYEIALVIAAIEQEPPDLRCFPLQRLKLRQTALPAGTRFDGATLSEAEFHGVELKGASFTFANLYEAGFAHVDLTGATFDRAFVDGVQFGDGAAPPDLSQAVHGRDDAKGAWASARDGFCRQVINRDFGVPP